MALLNPPSFLQNRDDHTAQQDRLMLGGLVASSGIGKIGDLKVTAQPAPNMSVQVAAGRCFIIGTQNTHQGVYHCYNDGPVTVNIAAASATLPRKDIIVAQVRDEFYSGANNDWQIVAITGVPASAPAEPALPANSLRLATIDVAANASTITNANIVASVLPARSALLGTALVCTSTTRPASPWEGLEIYETDTHYKRIWDGTVWQFVAGPDKTVQVTYGPGWTYTSSAAVIPVVTVHGSWATVQGAARRSSGVGEIAIVIPDGFRPATTVTWVPYAVNGGNAVARVFRSTFDTTGEVTITSASNGTQPVWDSATWFSITGIYPVER